MDAVAYVEQLERAANTVLAPPNLVSNQERQQAQVILQRFKEQREDVLPICNLILDKCRNELVLHGTVQVLRSILQLKWSELPPTEIDGLCEKLISVIFNTPNLSYGVHRSLATVLSLIMKRDCVLRDGSRCIELVQFLEPMMNGPAFSPVCSIFDALLSEHQFVTGNDDPLLSFDLHTAAKKRFEESSFLRIFQLSLNYLNNFNTNAPPNNAQPVNSGDNNCASYIQSHYRNLEMILSLLETVFAWNFASLTLTKRLAFILERDTSARWKPPMGWKNTIMNPAFFQIIFQTFARLRFTSEAFLSKIGNIVLQLISIHGPVIYGDQPSASANATTFLSYVVPHIITLIELPSKSPAEVLGLSDILRKLVIFYRASHLATVDASVLDKFLTSTATFTNFVIQQGVTEEANCSVEDRMYREATGRVLDMWTSIISDVDAIPKETLQPIAKNVFNAYVLGRISPPEGTRVPSKETLQEEFDEEEESDEIQFRDQLEIIGYIGRYIIQHSMKFINDLLAFKIQAFQNHITVAAAQGPAGKDSLLTLYEDLHWAIMIAGELISFDAMGDINLIPPEINQLSIEAASPSANSTHALLNSMQLQPIPENVDPVIKLVCQMFTLLEMETRLIESNMSVLLSPTVAQNILWFFNRWAAVYFIFVEDHYAAISEAFSTAWSESSQIIGDIQTLLFHRIRQNIVTFIGEEALIGEAIGLLFALVSSKRKAAMAIKSSGLGPLIDLLNHIGSNAQTSPMSSPKYQRFVKALTAIGTYCPVEAERREYFTRILGPISTRFQTLVGLIRSGGDKHRDDVRQVLISILNGFIGVALSSQSKSATELFATLSIVAKECGTILSTYNNYNEIVDLCLEFITQIGKHSLSYLPKAESYCLYECAMNVVKAYAHHAKGRHSREQTAEEDTYNDLLLLMEMLFCLLTKDLIDFSAVFRILDATVFNPEAENSTEPQILASDVCLQGLGIILPLMTADLIQYPALSSKYFKLISYVSELHADKVLQVQPWMLEALFRSVDLGLQKSVPDDFSNCCEFIACITREIGKHPQAHAHAAGLALPFLKMFLQMLLSQTIGKDYMASFSSTLFALISTFPDPYNALIRELLQTCPTEAKRTTLAQAFTQLTDNLNMRNGGDRMSRTTFKDRLEVFIFSASGSLNQ